MNYLFKFCFKKELGSKYYRMIWRNNYNTFYTMPSSVRKWKYVLARSIGPAYFEKANVGEETGFQYLSVDNFVQFTDKTRAKFLKDTESYIGN